MNITMFAAVREKDGTKFPDFKSLSFIEEDVGHFIEHETMQHPQTTAEFPFVAVGRVSIELIGEVRPWPKRAPSTV